MKPGLEAEVNTLHASVCAALADPTRIMILYELADGPRNVTQLSEAMAMPQSTTSRHLKVLREQGMVVATRQGMNVEYALGDPRVIQALDLLRGVLRDHLTRRADLAEAIA